MRNSILISSLIFMLTGLVKGEKNDISFGGIVIPDQSGKIVSVLGQIDPASAGITLMHEHLFLDFMQNLSLERSEKWTEYGRKFPTSDDEIIYWNEPFKVWNRYKWFYTDKANRDSHILDSLDDAIHETLLYKQLGGRTIVELTPINLGRQPAKLRQVMEQTGVNIVMGTGFYTHFTYPENMEELTVSDLTLHIIGDIVNGIHGTDVKAGIIGEVGAEALTFLPNESNEVRSLRATALASRLTGAAVSLHSSWRHPELWHTSLDILEKEGADLSRVIVGHVTALAATDIAFLESLLKRGVYLEFDTLGSPFSPLYPELDQRPLFEAITRLIAYGYSDKILVSHDIWSKGHLTKNGGNGLTFVMTALLPYLRNKGVNERSINHILVENPLRILTFVKPENIRSILKISK